MTVNIDEMPAGVELDILMAEALGYVQVTPLITKVIKDSDSIFMVVSGGSSIGNDKVYIRQISGEFTCFTPSIDIAVAWAVIEELHERGFYFSLTYENDGAEWNCWLNNAVGDVPASVDFEIEASSAPLAICRAVLKVMADD